MQFSPSNRLPELGQGDLGRFWGTAGVNNAFNLTDEALDGVALISELQETSTGVYRLAPANGATDTARVRTLFVTSSFTSGGGVVNEIVFPNIDKNYYFIMESGATTPDNIVKFSVLGTQNFVYVNTNSPSSTIVIVAEGKVYTENNKVIPRLQFINSSYTVLPSDHGKILLLNIEDTQRDITFTAPSTYFDGFQVTCIKSWRETFVPGYINITEPVFGSASTGFTIESWNQVKVMVATGLQDPGVLKFLMLGGRRHSL